MRFLPHGFCGYIVVAVVDDELTARQPKFCRFDFILFNIFTLKRLLWNRLFKTETEVRILVVSYWEKCNMIKEKDDDIIKGGKIDFGYFFTWRRWIIIIFEHSYFRWWSFAVDAHATGMRRWELLFKLCLENERVFICSCVVLLGWWGRDV